MTICENCAFILGLLIICIWLFIPSNSFSIASSSLDERTQECARDINSTIQPYMSTKKNYQNCAKFKAIRCNVLSDEYEKACKPYTNEKCVRIHKYMDDLSDSHVVTSLCSELPSENCAMHTKCKKHNNSSGIDVVFILILLLILFIILK